MTATDPARILPSPPPLPGTCYDARRGVYYTKPRMRGWLHLLWFEASLVLSTLLLTQAHGTARIASTSVYVASVTGLFGVSALYHCGTWSDTWRRRMQRLDHAMIFFLIAGTATPTFVLDTHGAFGLVSLITLWTLTISAAAIHMAWMNAPERLVGGTFIALGLVAALALPAVWMHSGTVPGVLILVGGLLYFGGAISFHHRWPDPVPSVFGFHECFHAWVCAAASCQFVAIAFFIR